jgi:hypothetical protein
MTLTRNLENYACAHRTYTGYCNPEIDKLFDQQSIERSREAPAPVWEIDKKLQWRSPIFHNRFATRCNRSEGLTVAVSQLFNGWRMEDVSDNKSDLGSHGLPRNIESMTCGTAPETLRSRLGMTAKGA